MVIRIWDGHIQLAAAVLERAVRDVKQGNGHAGPAWEFLCSDQAGRMFDALEIDHDVALSKLRPPAHYQPTLFD